MCALIYAPPVNRSITNPSANCFCFSRNFLQNTATFCAGMIISFYRGWELTLVILAVMPLIFICAVAFTKLLESWTKNELKSYAIAGSIADEVLTAVRTVFAFDAAKREHLRYEVNLEHARLSGIKKGTVVGATIGFLFLVIFSSYGLAFYYGWHLTLTNKEYNPGLVILVFFK